MIAIRRGEADFDPALDALLNLAREYTANVGNTSDAAWQAALSAGWSVEQLTELSAHVTLNLLTNYLTTTFTPSWTCPRRQRSEEWSTRARAGADQAPARAPSWQLAL